MEKAKYLTPLALSFLPLAALAQQDVRTEWLDSTKVRVAFSLAETDRNVGSNYAVLASPYLAGTKGDTLWLNPSVFRGKKNKRYSERAAYYNKETADPNTGNYMLNETAQYDVVLNRSETPWLWSDKVSLGVEREKQGCCDQEALPHISKGSFVYIPEFHPALPHVEKSTGKAGELKEKNPVLRHMSEYRPYDRTQILHNRKNALIVHFPVDKAEIDRSFRENAATLDRIIEITKQVAADTASSVRIIQIIGSASFEGSQKWNESLAGKRAEALKEYIRQRVQMKDSVFECNNGGEAWADFRYVVAGNDFEGRDDVLRIIDTENNPDRREKAIKRLNGGRTYAYIKDNLLHDQRNSGYVQIYYDYIDDKAAPVINRASELINQKKYDEALTLLKKVENDKRAYNALGVAYYMTGNKTLGMEYMRKAANEGNAQAAGNIRQLEAIEHAKQLENE